jgi:hypothetical protein
VFNPARPFTGELVGGARLSSRHPKTIILIGELAVFTELDNEEEYFDAASVVRLVPYAMPPERRDPYAALFNSLSTAIRTARPLVT